jgi:O-methyltransferase involved in polyketide biosynthesis
MRLNAISAKRFIFIFAIVLPLTYAWSYPRIITNLPGKIGVRGFDRTYYGLSQNNTIPDPLEVAMIVGVKPCMMAPKLVWKLAWKSHGALLPIFHFGDRAKPRDSKQSLKVLWCKAIASMDKQSKVYDDRWTYDTLPSSSRWLLRVLPNRLFPRLHHANIEARTAYLNTIIEGEINQVLSEHQNDNGSPVNIRIISLGAGYDVRCSRLLSRFENEHNNTSVHMDAYELDLEQVVQSKQKILDRIQRRRPDSRHPELISMDLNDLEGAVTTTLQRIITAPRTTTQQPTHTIFISEGVMIYLNNGVPSGLLKLLSETVRQSNDGTASLCFADRLENVPGGNRDAACQEMSSSGWELIDFCPKPGLARHMGLSRLLPSTT